MNDDRINGMKLYETVVTFTQDIKTIESLESFYKENEKDFFEKLKAMSPSYYRLAIKHMGNMRERIKSKKKYFVDVKMIWTQMIGGDDEEQVIENTKKHFDDTYGFIPKDKNIKVLGEVDDG